MKRRGFLTTAAASTGALLAAGPGHRSPRAASLVPGAHGAKGGRPNVLFIAVDDLNDWTGCLGGHPDARTPNLDRLAAQGVLFTNAHCAAPLCNPSRAAVMTGMRPSTTGVYDNRQPFRDSPVCRDAVTLSQHFRENGWSAVGAGKIYHGIYPDPPSWDEYWPSFTTTKPEDPMPPDPPLNGIPNTAHFDWGPVEVPPEKMGDRQVADWISARLSRRHDRPFFLACGFYRPHLPWYVPPEYFERFPLDDITLPVVREDDLDDVPAIGRRYARPDGDHAKVTAHGQWKRAVQGYLASISFADDCIGRVLDALDNGPNREGTIVVLWSDHGWHLGEKLHWRKFTLWEEATRNVLTIRAPGIAVPGGRCSSPVNLLDIHPTLTELCGLPTVPTVEGTSLAPLLRDPTIVREEPTLTTYLRGNHSLRTARWRYTRYRDGSEELYDHDADPYEWTNLAGDRRHDELKRHLARWLPATDAEESPHMSAEEARRQQKEMGIQLP